MTPEHFEVLLADMLASLEGRTLHAQHLLAGADPRHQFEERTSPFLGEAGVLLRVPDGH